MAYAQPPASALNFVFNRRLYTQPQANVVDFNMAATGQAEYSPIPGVIMDVATPWLPTPGRKESALAALFQQARELNVTRAASAANASTILDDRITMGHGTATDRSSTIVTPWDDSAQPRENTLVAIHKNGTHKDLEKIGLAWANASAILDGYMSSSFLVKTPWKDRQATARFRSTDLRSKTWLRLENAPEPIAKGRQGFADLGFLKVRKIYLDPTANPASNIEVGATFEVAPTQPKDPKWCIPYKKAPMKDIEDRIPWGPSGHRDTTLRFEYPDYNGPISPPALIRIPTLRFYIVANSAQIVRVSDGRDIPAVSVSMSIGSDSYSWNMQANLAGKDALALVEGTDAEPVEVDVMINGATWRVIIDGWRLSEAWRTGGGVVQGRSRVAYLAAPYANSRDYVEASGLTAQQLADQELPPGFTLNWNMVDWYVPAGAWQYQGLTPIDAIARIAAAGGGYVQAHPSSDEIIVNPLYPIAPWQFNTIASDFEIPRSVVIQRGSNKKPGQGVNGVYVYGGNTGGIAAHVVRQGTAGEVLVSTIVDALNVDTIPARERGIAALAASGRQSVEAHELPLSASLGGLIPVGSLIDMGNEAAGIFVPDWRGIVRGVTVAAGSARSGNGGTTLSVRQRLDVERHFDEGA